MISLSSLFKTKQPDDSRPRILMLVDKPNWAFDIYAKQIRTKLKAEFNIELKYVVENPILNPADYDLIWIYFWGETFYSQYNFDTDQIIKFVSSHRWEDAEDPNYPDLTPRQMATSYLRDASSVACVSLRLYNELKNSHPHVYLTRNGFDSDMFQNRNRRSGKLKLGWVGNLNDKVKGYYDVILPAVEAGKYELKTAGGNVTREQINDFYNDIDVILVASRNEGEPLTLVEGMAAGCFPVCTDVGLTSELITDHDNGIIVGDRTPEAFAEALKWCDEHIAEVREKGAQNAKMMLEKRSWDVFAPEFAKCFNETLVRKHAPKFRNDDVSVDSDLEQLQKFCETFWKRGYTQIHGVTLYGDSNTTHKHGEDAVEYEGYDSVAKLPNDTIVKLSEGKDFESRTDLIEFLDSSQDEIALHGLYHTDYSQMSEEEQREHIGKGLEKLDRLFPHKVVRYFIAPFNRTNDSLYKVCREFRLQVLSASGVHLESELDSVIIQPDTWYRYHHHRFYPDSKFDYYQLSLEKLDAALGRN